jgi:hypothetical protein
MHTLIDDEDPSPEHQRALVSARAALDDACWPLPVDEVTADTATGVWLTKPRFTGGFALAREWGTRTDTPAAHFDAYEGPDGATRAIIVHWK